MFSLEIDCDPEDRDLLIAELWEQGSAGIVELNPQTVRSFFEDDANRAALRELFPGARQREEEARDWVQSDLNRVRPALWNSIHKRSDPSSRTTRIAPRCGNSFPGRGSAKKKRAIGCNPRAICCSPWKWGGASFWCRSGATTRRPWAASASR